MRKIKPKKYYSTQIFSDQVAKLLAKHGLSQDEFNKRIGVNQAVTRWKKGETTPSADSLLAIKKMFAVSIDWLLTGEGREEPQAPPTLQEHQPETYAARPPAPVDTALLSQVLGTVSQALTEQKVNLTAAQQSRLSGLVYEHCARERERPTTVLVKRYLLLTD
jgi:transcriptional regulator with XRE-family HTH domain